MYVGVVRTPGEVLNTSLLLSLLVLLCTDGYRAECSENCQQCSSEGHRCYVCKDGFYGPLCQACSPLCLNNKCVPKLCSDGCIKGRYGEICQNKCDCSKGCNQFTGKCIHEQATDKKEPSNIDYHILVALLSFGAIGVLLTVAVFLKQKKFPYTRCLCITCDWRTKKTHKVPRNILRMRKSHSDISSTQHTSSFCITPTTPTGCTNVRHLAEAEPMLIPFYRREEAAPPPLPTCAEGESGEYCPPMYNSIFPHRKYKQKRPVK